MSPKTGCLLFVKPAQIPLWSWEEGVELIFMRRVHSSQCASHVSS